MVRKDRGLASHDVIMKKGELEGKKTEETRGT